MKTVTIQGLANSNATLSGGVVAMYSAQPLKVTLSASKQVRVTVSNSRTAQSISETRETIASGNAHVVEFDIARMIQLVCDVESVLGRVTYNGTFKGVAESVNVKIEYGLGSSFTTGADVSVVALYAACDWGETISADTVSRRLYVNFPQTIALSYDSISEGICIDTTEEEHHNIPYSGISPAALEVDIMQFLNSEMDTDYDRHKAGANCPIYVSFILDVKEGQGTVATETRQYNIKDDLTAFGKGVYLRWLHRDGTVGYWLFTKSKETIASAADKAFDAYVGGVLAAPTNGVIPNTQRQDFALTRTMTIGTRDVTEKEFEHLLGLASSPVVEMLVGGTRISPVWTRVNVVASSYAREYPKSGLKRLKTFELEIVTPERNTIKL